MPARVALCDRMAARARAVRVEEGLLTHFASPEPPQSPMMSGWTLQGCSKYKASFILASSPDEGKVSR